MEKEIVRLRQENDRLKTQAKHSADNLAALALHLRIAGQRMQGLAATCTTASQKLAHEAAKLQEVTRAQ